MILFQGGAAPDAELKGVPFVADLAKTADDRLAIEFLYAGQGIGRPFVAPPDMPPDRVKMVRDAFSDDHEGSGIRRGRQAQHARRRA